MSDDSGHAEYLNWQKKENSRWTKIRRNVKPIWIFVLPLIILGGNYLVASGQMSRGVFFIGVISFGVLFLFLIFRENTEPKLLPEHIIKQIVQEAFEKKQKIGKEIPFDAQIRVTLLAGSKYEQDLISGTSGIVSRQVGVEIMRKSYIKSYVVSLHPMNGTITNILPQPLGIGSKDALDKDVKIVPAQFLER